MNSSKNEACILKKKKINAILSQVSFWKQCLIWWSYAGFLFFCVTSEPQCVFILTLTRPWTEEYINIPFLMAIRPKRSNLAGALRSLSGAFPLSETFRPSGASQRTVTKPDKLCGRCREGGFTTVIWICVHFLVYSEVYLVKIKGTFLYTHIHHFLCSKDKIKEILLKENRSVIQHPASHDCAFPCNSLMWYQAGFFYLLWCEPLVLWPTEDLLETVSLSLCHAPLRFWICGVL